MGTLLRRIVVWYFCCGLVLGFIVWVSYVWGFNAAVSADVPMPERVKATVNIQPMIAPEIGTRVIAWGPSLAIWAAKPNGSSFGRWLAPGFYTKRLAQRPKVGHRDIAEADDIGREIGRPL